jgi:hypothetical protein
VLSGRRSPLSRGRPEGWSFRAISLCGLSLAAAKEEGRRSQRSFRRLSDSYFVSAILILALRFLSWLSDSYLGSAILILAQRFLFSRCDSYFGPAILILALRFFRRPSDPYFVPAILISVQRSLFWSSYSYLGSAILILVQRFLFCLSEESQRRCRLGTGGEYSLEGRAEGRWCGWEDSNPRPRV